MSNDKKFIEFGWGRGTYFVKDLAILTFEGLASVEDMWELIRHTNEAIKDAGIAEKIFDKFSDFDCNREMYKDISKYDKPIIEFGYTDININLPERGLCMITFKTIAKFDALKIYPLQDVNYKIRDALLKSGVITKMVKLTTYSLYHDDTVKNRLYYDYDPDYFDRLYHDSDGISDDDKDAYRKLYGGFRCSLCNR